MLVIASKPLAEAAASERLPTLYGYREHVQAGGLISYGVNLAWCKTANALGLSVPPTLLVVADEAIE